MSTKDPNLKVIFGADTSDFDKGVKDVKQGLKDLDKGSSSLMASFGSMFGVNTAKVEQMTSAIRGLGYKMVETGNAGAQAFGKVLASIGPIGGAIAGIGLGAAVAGFRELQKEADAFKQTVEGANIEMATAAYIDTYRQVLRDFNGDTAKALAESQSSWKKFWGEFKSTVSDFFVSGKFLNPAGSAASSAEQYRAAGEAAEKAEQYSNQIYQLERKRKEQAVELAKLNDDIANKLLVAKDTTKSVKERQEAIYEIELMLSQKKAMTVGLEQKLFDLYKLNSDLASDSVQDADALLAQESRVYEVSKSITQEEASVLKIKNSIGKASDAEIAKMNKLIEQQKELEQAISKTRAKWSSMNEGLAGLSGGSNPSAGVTAPAMGLAIKKEDVDYWKETFTAQLGQITIGVGFKADTEKIKDITGEVTSLLGSAVTRTSELIGSLLGTLAGGGNGWGEFKNAAISAFGDMAIAIGKIAISAGLAVSGIQAAINSGNWYVAVAAGAALVALGTAVKSSLSAVANGDYSASGGGYSSAGYSSGAGSNDYEQREVKVYVTGTLEADGDKLITVIQNANKKNYYTQ